MLPPAPSKLPPALSVLPLKRPYSLSRSETVTPNFKFGIYICCSIEITSTKILQQSRCPDTTWNADLEGSFDDDIEAN